MVTKLYTLVFLRRHQQVLLGLKKRGFGVNKWNGFGGKVESNESIVEGAIRELEEECRVSVNANDLKNIGHLEFTFEGEPLLMDVRVFSATVFSGNPEETEEMRPMWYDLKNIPFNEMWPDDPYWFPYMLSGKLFYGKFHYMGFDRILNHSIKELDSMEKFYASRS